MHPLPAHTQPMHPTASRFAQRLTTRISAGLVTLLLSIPAPASAAARERLVIDYIISNTPQRTAWIGIIDQFSAANPDIEVVPNGYPQEPYKRDFTARLRSGDADVAFWYAGERLRDAAHHKLLAPLDADTVALLKKTGFAPATIEGTRIAGRVYGFPLYYYVWGFIYRKSLFDRLGITPPATWDEFLHVCQRLKAAGVTPLALGARSGWPAAGWFDYLDLRLNGIEFHRKLLRGDARFSDARVRRVFDVWGDLLRKGYFLDATIDQDMDRVMPYLYRNHAAMVLTGSFAASRFPPSIAADMRFFGFPNHSPDMPTYEEAPLDVLVLPARGRNPRARRRFLAFLAETGALRKIAEADQTLSAQNAPDAIPRHTWLGGAPSQVWNKAAGLTFFFDRDARAELVAPTYEGLRRFLKAPHDTDQVVRYIDQAAMQARLPQKQP